MVIATILLGEKLPPHPSVHEPFTRIKEGLVNLEGNAMTRLAIIPILVQASTALPAVATGVAFFITLLRPLVWLRHFVVRKPILTLVALTGLVASSALIVFSLRSCAHSSPRRDWAQVALNIIQSKQAKADSSLGVTNAPRHLTPAWEFKQTGAMFLSTPILRHGRLYGASCTIDVGGTYGSIFCLDAATGRPIWQIDKIDNQYLKGIFSSPALSVDGRHIVIGEGLHFDNACHLICLETETGRLHWKIDIPANHVESSPAVFGDFVVVGAGAIEHANHLPIESPGYAIAVRISDGEVLWRKDIVDPESSPAIAADGVIYIGSGINGCAIVALRADGQPEWQTSTPYPATGPVLLAGDYIITGTGRGDLVNADPHPGGAVLKINRFNGEIVWRRDLTDAVLGQVAIADGRIFCPVRDGTVVALDLEDGRKIWNKTISEAPVLAGVASSGKNLYAVSSNGILVILDATTGELLEKHALNDEANPGRSSLSLSAPFVSEGRVYVGSETGGLRCFVGAPNK